MYSASTPNITLNFSEAKFKVQDQNHRTNNLLLVGLIYRPWFKTGLSSANLAIRQYFGVREFKMAPWRWFALSGLGACQEQR